MPKEKILKTIALSIVGVFAVIGALFTFVFAGMQFGLFNVRGSAAERDQFFNHQSMRDTVCDDTRTLCEWNQTPEWATIREGLIKDSSVIADVSEKTGVSKRMIASVVIPEQVRFFTSEREIFKRYFEPLKILGSLSQFSLGVSGIKQETANTIEQNATDSTSPFYPGSKIKELIVYQNGVDHDTELYNRLTDPKNHYYSYLYTALYIKEVETEWKQAGYDIAQAPGVVATLFNIGFQASHPNPKPQVGGSEITTGGKIYAFGELGALFYSSDELTDVFPK
ncbi:MAG: hypothetical protein V4437_03095 [Patescibacteria group bacterium]